MCVKIWSGDETSCPQFIGRNDTFQHSPYINSTGTRDNTRTYRKPHVHELLVVVCERGCFVLYRKGGNIDQESFLKLRYYTNYQSNGKYEQCDSSSHKERAVHSYHTHLLRAEQQNAVRVCFI